MHSSNNILFKSNENENENKNDKLKSLHQKCLVLAHKVLAQNVCAAH